MGSDEPESHVAEKPIHTVRITKPFYIGKYPVMVSEFSQFVAATKLVTTGETRKDGYAGWGLGDGSMAKANDIHWRNPGFQQTDRDPVVMVTPVEAMAYCDYMSKTTGKRLRLPTEAEWEYAARGPENLRYPWGNTWNGTLCNHADRTLRTAGYPGRHTDGCPDLRYAGYEQNKTDTETDNYAFTSPVGALKNASWCGAYDMSGNVWQWVTDFKDDKYYASSPQDDPTGAINGLRVRRGGSFLNDSINCRSTQRFQGGGEERDVTTGFRLLMEVDQVSMPSNKGPEDKPVPASPTVTPNDDKLAFRDDGRGNFVFNTGLVQGSVQKEGTSDTLRPVSYVDPDLRINGDNHGLLIPYRCPDTAEALWFRLMGMASYRAAFD
jgi:formylglycine-generating enzyme required for sulfatase activity